MLIIWLQKKATKPGKSYYVKVLRQELPGVSVVKNPPAVQEILVWSLGWEDPVEKGMGTHSRILAWEIPWTEEWATYNSWSRKESDMFSN